MPSSTPTVRILGTRGVPANHGGFETAAERIGLELVRRGWRVVVYCQVPGNRGRIREDVWRGIERVHVPERVSGPLGTIWFDALAVRHAAAHRDLCLTFGYNTAFLNQHLRAKGIATIINMDGIEWRRARWTPMQRHFLHLNERIACRIGDALIADHPEIARHLETIVRPEKVTTITYGSDAVVDADPGPLRPLGLEPGRYLTIVARPVAENGILEMVSTFSSVRRGARLLVLGEYSPADDYHRAVLGAASDEVVFAGPQYDHDLVQSLRYHSMGHLHGHTVGGTNPSLVEAMGAGNAIIARDNAFNRWVAQGAALYFDDTIGLDRAIDTLIRCPATVEALSEQAVRRHQLEFGWNRIVDRYEALLLDHLPVHQAGHQMGVASVRVPDQRETGPVPPRLAPVPRPRPGGVDESVAPVAPRSTVM